MWCDCCARLLIYFFGSFRLVKYFVVVKRSCFPSPFLNIFSPLPSLAFRVEPVWNRRFFFGCLSRQLKLKLNSLIPIINGKCHKRTHSSGSMEVNKRRTFRPDSHRKIVEIHSFLEITSRFLSPLLSKEIV